MMKKYTVKTYYGEGEVYISRFDSYWYDDNRSHTDFTNETVFGYIRRVGKMFDDKAEFAGNTISVNDVEVWNKSDGFILTEDWLKQELIFNLKK